MLEKEHQIHIATAGEQGLQLATELKPDMDGYEVCKKLKQNAATAGNPLLFHSAHADTKEQMQGYAAGWPRTRPLMSLEKSCNPSLTLNDSSAEINATLHHGINELQAFLDKQHRLLTEIRPMAPSKDEADTQSAYTSDVELF